MKVKADFTNTEEYPKMKEGKQKLTVFECYTQNSKKGDPMVVFNFENKDKSRVYLYCMNTEKNRWGLKQVLGALWGKTVEKGPVEFETGEMINLSLIGKVYYEAHEGKTYPKVGDIEPCLKTDDTEPQPSLDDDSLPF